MVPWLGKTGPALLPASEVAAPLTMGPAGNKYVVSGTTPPALPGTRRPWHYEETEDSPDY